jgi:hypothetical protein
MRRRSDYLMSYFYYVVIFFIVSTINILPQDNTNNMMQDKMDRSNNNDSEKKIEQNANYYASNLKTILNLTDSQTRYIYDIMLHYYLNRTGYQTSQRAALRESKESFKPETEPLKQNMNNIDASDNNTDLYLDASSKANKKIENILDTGQKNKWREINDSWWVNVKTELYEGDQNIKLSKEINERNVGYEDNRDYENFDVYYPGYDFK